MESGSWLKFQPRGGGRESKSMTLLSEHMALLLLAPVLQENPAPCFYSSDDSCSLLPAPCFHFSDKLWSLLPASIPERNSFSFSMLPLPRRRVLPDPFHRGILITVSLLPFPRGCLLPAPCFHSLRNPFSLPLFLRVTLLPFPRGILLPSSCFHSSEEFYAAFICSHSPEEFCSLLRASITQQNSALNICFELLLF